MKALDTRAHVLGQEKAIDQLLRDYRPEKHVFKSVMTFTTTTYQTASRSQRLQTMESQQVLSYDICCEWFDAYNLQGRAANLWVPRAWLKFHKEHYTIPRKEQVTRDAHPCQEQCCEYTRFLQRCFTLKDEDRVCCNVGIGFRASEQKKCWWMRYIHWHFSWRCLWTIKLVSVRMKASLRHRGQSTSLCASSLLKILPVVAF